MQFARISARRHCRDAQSSPTTSAPRALSALSRRRIGAILIAATSGLALLSPADPAYGTTFTFVTTGGDWLDPNNWTPNGLPGAADLAKIRTFAGPTMTLNGGSLTVGAILDDSSNTTTLSNSASDATNSTLTLAGLPDTPLIEMTRSVSGTTFTIQGPNGGTGTGTLGLVLGASGDMRVTSGATLNITADVSESGGARGITKTGGGTLILAGNNSFSGALNQSSGTVVLSGANPSAGPVTINSGAVRLDFGASTAPKLSGSSTVTMNGARLMMFGNDAAPVTQSLGGLNLGAGSVAVTVDVSGGTQQSATLSLGAISRPAAGTAVNFTLTNNATSGGVAAANTSSANGPYGILGGWAVLNGDDWAAADTTPGSEGNIIPFAGYVQKDDASTWAAGDNLTNSGGYTGTVNTTLTIGSLRFNANANDAITIGGGQTLIVGSGGILVTSTAGAGASAHTVSGGAITSGNGQDLIVNINGSKTLTLSSTLSDNGATPIGLTKNGTGNSTLKVLGAHTYTGPVFLNGGTLEVDTIAPGGTPSGLGAGSGTVTIGSNTNFGTLSYVGSGDATTDRPLVLGADGMAFRIAPGRTLTFTGPVSGSGTLNKYFASTLALPGAKDFSGEVNLGIGTIVADSIANLGTPSSLGTGLDGATITVGNGNPGTLLFTGGSASTDRPLALGSLGGSSTISIAQSSTTLTLTGGFFFNNTNASNPRPLFLSGNGAIVETGPITGLGSVTRNGTGTATLSGSNSFVAGLTVASGTLIAGHGDALADGTVTISSGGTLKIADGLPTAVKVSALNNSGTVDLSDGKMVIDYAAGSSPLATVQSQVTSGYASGAWTGPGINSSRAAADASSAHKTAVGYGEASAVFSTFPTSFAGQDVDADTVLLRYTYSGDANLDGKVDTLDFNALAANFGGSGKVWTQADFNFDGTVDTLDFNNLAANFGQSLPGDNARAGSATAAGGTLVPEPGMLSLLAFAAGSLCLRRRRSRDKV